MTTLAMLAAHSPPRADPDSPLALYRKSEEKYKAVHINESDLNAIAATQVRRRRVRFRGHLRQLVAVARVREGQRGVLRRPS